MSFLNNIVNELDIALKTLSDKKTGTDRVYPPIPEGKNSEDMSQKEKNLSIKFMRINHAGEVAAQALYRGQAFVCKDPEVKKHLIHAGDEETDHLVWCKKRLDELGGNSSALNPLWYAGSFAIGAIFGSMGEKTSLGFVEETEKQVVIHLQKHLDKVSHKDKETIAILKTMQADEDLHAGQANESGAEELESPTKKVMEVTAKVMTSTSAYI
ncbi:MAG: 2-polyprenyl-3-methyl-6-methoxy-1,4-benzoquinone monooxygenase [Gammaproteobacteria bacterium]|jgi:ubiquinone biosynthesis monooxygenase Coq7|nr:demethoxyubiquinone hydroxylase family protein [Gammaproteobacteria bacterium]|tara:strand:+ start:36 stop:671 length:636 start_codon:yes stop_codon:yes gene_type:complete